MNDEFTARDSRLEPGPIARAFTLGARIKAARLEKGMSQEALARPFFTKSYISAVERGKVRPSLKAFELIAQKLEIPMSEFLLDDLAVTNPRNTIRKAEALILGGDWDLALEALEGVTDPTLANAVKIMTARAWVAGGAATSVGAIASQVLAAQPTGVEKHWALYLRGQAWLVEGQYRKAVEDLLAAYHLGEDNPDGDANLIDPVRRLLIEAYQGVPDTGYLPLLGDRPALHERLTGLITDYARKSAAANEAGDVALSARLLDQATGAQAALEALLLAGTEMLALPPEQEQSEQALQAVVLLGAITGASSQQAEALQRLARAAIDRHEYASASDYAQKAIQAAPGEPAGLKGYIALADAQSAGGQRAEASATMRQALTEAERLGEIELIKGTSAHYALMLGEWGEDKIATQYFRYAFHGLRPADLPDPFAPKNDALVEGPAGSTPRSNGHVAADGVNESQPLALSASAVSRN